MALMNLESEHLICRQSEIAGLGLYATRRIARGGRLIEYLGERIDGAEMVRRCAAGNHYIFKLNDTCYLDGKIEANVARFINHSCDPNCGILWEHDRIWIVAARDLENEEEITFNYGYDLEDYQHYPCTCGSVQCVRFIVAEEYFDHVRRQNEIKQEAASAMKALQACVL
jgi:SET domain-containing protein